ncbi:MAG: chemotaxis protein CheR [Proteobacteria bacterium]|nr:chemotaxis protein CheR [Pseudomonadota bacterium]
MASTTDHGVDQAISFTQADFDKVRKLIHQRAGISLHEGKRAMVYSRLTRRLREGGHTDVASYLRWLEDAGGAQAEAEWQEFINCLTTNLTSFFREEHHFFALTDLLRGRFAGKGRGPRIWCCAASTGEEPYSIAMVVNEELGPQHGATLLATDIDTQVLATARRGVYDAQARGLSPERLKRHMQRGTGANSGRIRVRPELARMIDFQPFNLISPRWSLGEPFDLVFCRNVMIYFDHTTQREVLARIHAAMRPEGVLFVGHSENFTDARTLFHLQGKTIYRRV